MKNWRAFFKESLTKEHVKAQFKPGSQLWRIFIFSLVAAISLGVIYNFVGKYIIGTRAATETVTVTAGASKNNVALNEEFTVNVLFSGANAKKISQLDLRMKVAGTAGGTVEYVPTKFQSTPVGSTATNYFDTTVLETGSGSDLRLVLSSRKPEAELSDRVIVKVTFKGKTNGQVQFDLDAANMEVVGPGGENVPTTFSFGPGSNTSTRVTIGEGPSATPIPASPTGAGPTTGPTAGPTSPVATPTITIAPPPGCNNAQAMNCQEAQPVSMIFNTQENTI